MPSQFPLSRCRQIVVPYVAVPVCLLRQRQAWKQIEPASFLSFEHPVEDGDKTFTKLWMLVDEGDMARQLQRRSRSQDQFDSSIAPIHIFLCTGYGNNGVSFSTARTGRVEEDGVYRYGRRKKPGLVTQYDEIVPAFFQGKGFEFGGHFRTQSGITAKNSFPCPGKGMEQRRLPVLFPRHDLLPMSGLVS